MRLFSRLLGKQQDQLPNTLVHEACGGAIRVFGVPNGEGWYSQEDEREGDGFVVNVLKYVLDAEPFPLTLSAKVYSLPAREGAPEDPAATDWISIFGSLFRTEPEVAANSGEQTTMHVMLKAMEARITGVEREQGAPLFIRERRAVLGKQQFIVTASGPVELCKTQVATIEAWFQNVAF